MSARTVQIGAQGRIVLPAPIRRELGLSEGSELLARVDGVAIVLEPRRAAVDRIQTLVRESVSPKSSLVDQLIAERRDETRRDRHR